MRWKAVGALVGVLGLVVMNLGAMGSGAATSLGTPAAGAVGSVQPFVPIPCCGGGGGGGTSYIVTFQETGLPQYTNWSVTINGTGGPVSSNGNTIAVAEFNASYNYTVGTISGYASWPAGGAYTVNGKALTLSITFRPTTYQVKFNETGLPAGTPWWISLNGGALVESTQSTLLIPVSNGNYIYQVYAPTDYPSAVYYVKASQASGSFVVNGAPVAVTPAIKFTSLIWSIKFTESGLSTGASWNVTLSNTTWSRTDVANAPSSIPFDGLYNATYSYVVKTASGCSASPTSGTYVVSGASKTIAVTFSCGGGALPASTSLVHAPTLGNQVHPYVICCGGGGAPDYAVTFTESGLAPGTTWSVNVSGWTIAQNTSSILFEIPNGSWNYSVGVLDGFTALPQASVVTVNGAAVNASIQFLATLYEVKFTESGLAASTPWWVGLNGGTPTESTFGQLMIPTSSGSFTYQVYPPQFFPSATYAVNRTSGSSSLSGAPVVVSNLKFSLLVWTIKFTESGLPSGTLWAVTLNNATWKVNQTTTGTSTTFRGLYNATYSYVVHPPSGYVATPTTGSYVLSGTSKTIAVTFT